eukprot:Clim_evm14s229 gene=Clim_evmTU14s229
MMKMFGWTWYALTVFSLFSAETPYGASLFEIDVAPQHVGYLQSIVSVPSTGKECRRVDESCGHGTGRTAHWGVHEWSRCTYTCEGVTPADDSNCIDAEIDLEVRTIKACGLLPGSAVCTEFIQHFTTGVGSFGKQEPDPVFHSVGGGREDDPHKGEADMNIFHQEASVHVAFPNIPLTEGQQFLEYRARHVIPYLGTINVSKKDLPRGGLDSGGFVMLFDGSSYIAQEDISEAKEKNNCISPRQDWTSMHSGSSVNRVATEDFVGSDPLPPFLQNLALMYKHVEPSASPSKPVTIYSSSSHFLVASHANVERHLEDDGVPMLKLGLMGSVKSVPVGYDVSFMEFSWDMGIHAAFLQWGSALRMRYNLPIESTRPSRFTDYLGYYTDNGAWYYYRGEPTGKRQKALNPNGTRFPADMPLLLKAVANAADNDGIPFRHGQMDSWWYEHGEHDGVKAWEPNSQYVPSGKLDASDLPHQWFGWTAHNRWWDEDTTYAKDNGGEYEIYIEHVNNVSIPLGTDDFWNDLMRKAKVEREIGVYEQDWLDEQMKRTELVRQDAEAGDRWMRSMGKGAIEQGVEIQLCMVYPRHVLSAVSMASANGRGGSGPVTPVVTHIRGSDDYQPGNQQWQGLGLSSYFIFAVGAKPFKDTLWSTPEQPGSPYGTDAKEPRPALQVAVSVLTSGPVVPGDRMGHWDAALINRACNSSGRLLRAGHPAHADETLLALQAMGIPGWWDYVELWATGSYLAGYPDGPIFITVFAALRRLDNDKETCMKELLGDEEFNPLEFAPMYAKHLLKSRISTATKTDGNAIERTGVQHQGLGGTIEYVLDTVQSTIANARPPPSATPVTDFDLYHWSPVLLGGRIAVLGEYTKWMPLSPDRMTLSMEDLAMTISFFGGPSEDISLAFASIPGTKVCFTGIGGATVTKQMPHVGVKTHNDDVLDVYDVAVKLSISGDGGLLVTVA